MILIWGNPFYGKMENWDQITPSNSPRHVTLHQHSGKKGSIARRHSEVYTSWARPVRSQVCGEDIRRNLAQRKMRPQSSMGLGEKCLCAQNTDKATFHSPIEARAMPALTSKSPKGTRIRGWLWSINAHAEQKRFQLRWNGYFAEIQDSYDGGDRKWRSANKRKTTGLCLQSWSLRNSAITRWHACSFITWKTLRSKRKYLWVGQRSKVTSDQTREEDPLQDWKFPTLRCPRIVVKFWCQLVFYIATAGLIKYIFKSSNRATCRSGTRKLARYTKKPTKRKRGTTGGASGNRLRDLPYWLQEFTENLEDTEVPAPAHMSPDSESEHPAKVTSRKHRIYTHLPKDRNCEVCLRTKITRTPCRRRTDEAVPRAKKFGDLITADHKVLNEDGESRNNSRYVVVVQDLVTQRTQSYLCKTKTSQETEKFQESFSSLQKWHWQFFGIWQITCRSIMELLDFNITSIRDEWDCRKSSTKSKRRYLCCNVAIRLGWKMVGWFCGTLLPSAKCWRPPGRRENSSWKTIRRTIERTDHPFGAMVEYYPISSRDQARLHQFARKLYLEYSSDMHWLRVEFRKEM